MTPLRCASSGGRGVLLGKTPAKRISRPEPSCLTTVGGFIPAPPAMATSPEHFSSARRPPMGMIFPSASSTCKKVARLCRPRNSLFCCPPIATTTHWLPATSRQRLVSNRRTERGKALGTGPSGDATNGSEGLPRRPEKPSAIFPRRALSEILQLTSSLRAIPNRSRN